MRVSVVGATGYSGVELLRLLLAHPEIELSKVVSHSSSGQRLSGVFPHLSGIIDDVLDGVNAEQLAEHSDLIFTATPAGVSHQLVPQWMEMGVPVIDLSGDFRLKDSGLYKTWYKKETAEEKWLQQAVYGLTEWYREAVAKAKWLSNPGCYPTCTLLGLAPLIEGGWIDPRSIVVDAKSGVSGAGRSVGLGTHFSEVNENLKAYKVGVHQHIPEIEQVLAEKLGEHVPITFTTHLIPITRGMMCTIVAQVVKQNASSESLHEAFRQFYEGEPFVRVRPLGRYPATKEVMGSNYCDIGMLFDDRTGRVTVVSVIDNLGKGAAGQAVQNMNVMMGWDERLGLMDTPLYP
jgi:N-acetyl-gamma-glutamyl-phosphate reductase